MKQFRVAFLNMRPRLFVPLLLLVVLAGCSNQLREPELTPQVVSITVTDLAPGETGSAMGINDLNESVGSLTTTVFAEGFLRSPGGVITLLGDLGSGISAGFDINLNSQVVGTSVLAGGGSGKSRGFIWQDDIMTNLGLLPPDHLNTFARAINDMGYVVGEGRATDNTCEDNLPSEGFQICSFVIVPEDVDGDGVLDWFSDDGNGFNTLMIDLGSFGGGDTIVADINAHGYVVGGSRPPGFTAGNLPGFLIVPEDTDGDGAPDTWYRDTNMDGVNDLMIPLALPGDGFVAVAINDLGQIAGTIGQNPGTSVTVQAAVITPVDTDGDSFPDKWVMDEDGDDFNDLLTDLATLGREGGINLTFAADIDNFGNVVGLDVLTGVPPHACEHTGGPGDVRAFLWNETDGMMDLGTLGGPIARTYALNNLGRVVGDSQDVDCELRVTAWDFVINVPPEEQLDNLRDLVMDLVDQGLLNNGQGNALFAKLDAAAFQLAKGKPGGAINLLEAFINTIEGFVNAGILTQAEADPVIEAANALIDELSNG